MGGRGQEYSIISRLFNYKHAYIPRNKLKNYLLNPSKDPNKAKFFQSLGYNMKNYEQLEKDILAKLKTNNALKYETDEMGNTEFQVNMELGITRKAIVATGWVLEKGSKTPRLTTAYHNKSYEKKLKKKRGY